jgi:WLM domain
MASWLTSLFTGNYPLTSIKSTVDGRTYKVRDLPDKQEAANLMATVRMKLSKLCNMLEQKYPDKAQVKLIVKNFRDDPDRFMESTPDASHTSYSVNKGEEIHLCLRQRAGGNESLVDENVMVFVGLHELGHVCTESVGHGPDFWNNFGWLLKEAEGAGIYRYTDFQSHPVSYCGVSITDSPRYDPAKDGTNLQIGTITK